MCVPCCGTPKYTASFTEATSDAAAGVKMRRSRRLGAFSYQAGASWNPVTQFLFGRWYGCAM